MTDLYEPLREKLRCLGWKCVQRGKLNYWQNPDGGEFAEDEAFAQLRRLEDPDPGPD